MIIIVCAVLFLFRHANVERSAQIQTKTADDSVPSRIESDSTPSHIVEEVALPAVAQDSLHVISPDTIPPASTEESIPSSQGDSLLQSSGPPTPVGREKVDQVPVSGPKRSVRLTLRGQAVSDTWVRVLCDGSPAYEGMLRSGSTVGWEADSLFELKMSKAGGVLLNLNGRPLGNLGPTNNVVSSLILNRDGIVKKVLK